MIAPLVFWLLGEFVLGPLSVAGIMFVAFRWIARNSTVTAAIASLSMAVLLLLVIAVAIAGG